MTTKESQKFLLSLKLKQLRLENNLSLKSLSSVSGLSSSYLNEIEKGKKFPSESTLKSLENALGFKNNDLLKESNNKMDSIKRLLDGQFFKNYPFELWGISKHDIFDIISSAPEKFSSLLNAFLAISKNFDISLRDIQMATLRAYQEDRDNYFEEIEDKVDEFKIKHDLISTIKIEKNRLRKILEEEYNYKITFNEDFKDLNLKYIYYYNRGHKLFINKKLPPIQINFILAKEIGHQVLKTPHNKRGDIFLDGEDFESLINDFKTSYFSGALLLNKDFLVSDIKDIFKEPIFEMNSFSTLIEKYGVGAETFINRLTQIFPRYFGLRGLFYFKIKGNQQDNLGRHNIIKELHLNKIHAPHGIGLNEHYCRRWVSLKVLSDLNDENLNNKTTIDFQKSIIHNTSEEYFVVSMAKKSTLFENGQNTCITLGIQIDDNFKNKVKFFEDKNLKSKIIGQTCERCEKMDCEERLSAPYVIMQNKMKFDQMNAISTFIKNQNN